ncbi:MAG: hypothetical protein WAK53_18805 [Chromatiaceae bacterium]
MKHTTKILVLVGAALPLMLNTAANVATAALEEGQVIQVCYEWDAYPDERLRVSIRKPAPITETDPAQVEWGLTGKHIGACGEGTTPMVRGTIIADEVEGVAHMGIYTIAVRGNGDSETCRTVNWRCSAPSPERAPDTWFCDSRNEFDVYHGKSTLTKVPDLTADPLCGAFEEGLSSPSDATSSGTAF